MFGGHRLFVLLSILFDMFIRFSFLGLYFVPLVKCKTVNLSDVNNYRAIAMSNTISKILECILFKDIESDVNVDRFQFGFKKQRSTADCTPVLKRTVSYYRQRGSHVFACFVDFYKAFDNVDYWLLFCKLLDSSSSATHSNFLVCICYHTGTVTN